MCKTGRATNAIAELTKLAKPAELVASNGGKQERLVQGLELTTPASPEELAAAHG